MAADKSLCSFYTVLSLPDKERRPYRSPFTFHHIAIASANTGLLSFSVIVHAILKETEERELRQLKLKRSGKTIRKIIDEECEKSGISPQEVMNGVRRRIVSNLRAAIALRGRTELGRR